MKSLVFAILILLTGCSSLSANEPVNSEKDDYYSLFSGLLGINETRFTYTDNEGNIHVDQLRLFKELEAVYIRNIEAQDNGQYSQEQVKVIMFFAFYAKNRNSSAFSEYLASDLKPIYSENRAMFLTLMNELPFFIPSVCDRLNAFFGFEGKNIAGKDKFLNENKGHFETNLSTSNSASCLAQFGQ